MFYFLKETPFSNQLIEKAFSLFCFFAVTLKALGVVSGGGDGGGVFYYNLNNNSFFVSI